MYPAATIAPAKMVPGGTFEMGKNDPAFPDAYPVHRVKVNSFWMDEHEVTNAEFAKFVAAANYITIAERHLDTKDYPGVEPESLVPGSGVFFAPSNKLASMIHLSGGGMCRGQVGNILSGLKVILKAKKMIPVHVSYYDAIAYAKWAGKRLPTEAEWEYAAQGNKPGLKYYWGNELKPGANGWPTFTRATFQRRMKVKMVLLA